MTDDATPVARVRGRKRGVNHLAEITALADNRGGMTPEDVRAECRRRGLLKKTAANYVWAVRKAGRLKEAC